LPGLFGRLAARLKNALPQAAHAGQLAGILWSPVRGWTVAWLGVLTVAATLPIASVLLLKRLVDSVLTAMKAGMSPAVTTQVLAAGGSLAGVWVAGEVVTGLSEWIRTAQSEAIQDHVAGLIQAKSVSVDYAFYECPEYYDRLYRARDEAKGRISSLLEHAGNVLQNSITIALLSTIVARYNGFLLVALAVGLIPAFVVIVRFNWLTHQWWSETTAQRRWLNYYDLKFSSPASAAEIRLLRLGPRFQAAYRMIRVGIREAHLRLITRQTVTRGVAAASGIVIAGVPVGWIAWQAMQGKASFGDLVVFYQAFLGGQGFMRAVTLSMAHVYSSTLYMTNLCEFLSLPSVITDPPQPAKRPTALRRSIEFHNVTFRYPGSERIALRNVNLVVPAGKVVAIVGPNGAGKSTVVKLLSRFYDPAAGAITIDGIPLQDYALGDVRSFFSVLCQMPSGYDATVADNILFGDIDAEPAPERVLEAARRAGAEEVIARLPRQYDTLLGKSFAGGTELSAGEWQRISMARAFFRKAPVVLLDEPTSFMDPWSEAAWCERVKDLARDRTVVLVTHRFTIAMRTDLIYVMQDSEVVECGTHSELIAKAGVYAQSWFEQVTAGETEQNGSRGDASEVAVNF
jgi:ATP-binding cassette, subfamily B, bacterial